LDALFKEVALIIMSEKIQKLFNSVLQTQLIEEIRDKGRLLQAKEGEVLIDYGNYIKQMPFVLEGSLKIIRQDEGGNELFLYYLKSGDICAMSMSCCFQHKKSEVRAVAEENSEIWMVPVDLMEDWIKKYYSWREFVFHSYNDRFEELLTAVDNVAFLKLDQRLLKYLDDKKEVTGHKILYNTHQEIAKELNTSRVVVSRLLKQLEREGKIILSRNKIKLLS